MKLEQAYRGGFDGRPGWWLHLNYDQDGIEKLKGAIPSALRTWDGGKKRWWCADEALDWLLKIVPALEAHPRQGSLL